MKWRSLLIGFLRRLLALRCLVLLAPLAILVAICVVVGGCGGSSSSSGPDNLEIHGTIVSLPFSQTGTAVDPVPVANIQVIVAKTTNSATTDAQGNFSLSVSSPGHSVQLSIEFPAGELAYLIQNIPSDAASVVLKLRYEPDTAGVIPSFFEFQDSSGVPIQLTPTPGLT